LSKICAALGRKLRNFLKSPHQSGPATPRPPKTNHARGEGINPKPITATEGEEKQGRRKLSGKKKFSTESHGRRAIQKKINRGLNLAGKDLGHEFFVAGVDGPVDEAEIVSWLIGAVIGELQ
jgi:hypothetical protein